MRTHKMKSPVLSVNIYKKICGPHPGFTERLEDEGTKNRPVRS